MLTQLYRPENVPCSLKLMPICLAFTSTCHTVCQVNTYSVNAKALTAKLAADCTGWVPSPCTFKAQNIYWEFPTGSQYKTVTLWDYSNLYRKGSHQDELSQCATLCSMDPDCHAYLIDKTSSRAQGYQPTCQMHKFASYATLTGSAVKSDTYPLYGNVKEAAKTSLGLHINNNNCAAYPVRFGSDLPSACPACPEKTYWFFDANGQTNGKQQSHGSMTLEECVNVCASIGSLWRTKDHENYDSPTYCDAVLMDGDTCITWMLTDDITLRASCEKSGSYGWYGKVNAFATSTAGKGLSVVSGDSSCHASTVIQAGAPGSKCAKNSDCTIQKGLVHGVCEGASSCAEATNSFCARLRARDLPLSQSSSKAASGVSACRRVLPERRDR